MFGYWSTPSFGEKPHRLTTPLGMWELGAVPGWLRNHLTANAGHLHLIEAYCCSASDLGVAVCAAVPDGSNKGCNISVGGFASFQMRAGSLEKPEQFEVVGDHVFRVKLLRKDKLTLPDIAVPVPAIFNSELVKKHITSDDPWGVKWTKTTPAVARLRAAGVYGGRDLPSQSSLN